MLNQDQIKGKWKEIKGGVRNLWGLITDDELDKTKGNISSISGLVQERYGESKKSISEKLDRLMESFDNETDKSLKINDGEASYQRNPTGTKSVDDNENLDFGAGSDEDSYDSSEIFENNTKKINRSEDRIARH